MRQSADIIIGTRVVPWKFKLSSLIFMYEMKAFLYAQNCRKIFKKEFLQ